MSSQVDDNPIVSNRRREPQTSHVYVTELNLYLCVPRKVILPRRWLSRTRFHFNIYLYLYDLDELRKKRSVYYYCYCVGDNWWWCSIEMQNKTKLLNVHLRIWQWKKSEWERKREFKRKSDKLSDIFLSRRRFDEDRGWMEIARGFIRGSSLESVLL